MRVGAQPAGRPDDVQSAPPESSLVSTLSPFGDSTLATSSPPSGASEPDLSEAERHPHVSAARSQSTTSALRRLEYASKNRKAMARLAEHNGGRDSGDMKRTRSVRLGLARMQPQAASVQKVLLLASLEVTPPCDSTGVACALHQCNFIPCVRIDSSAVPQVAASCSVVPNNGGLHLSSCCLLPQLVAVA